MAAAGAIARQSIYSHCAEKEETLQSLGLNFACGLDADSTAEAASFRHDFACDA